MKKVEISSFDKPVEVRTFPKGRVELIEVGGTVIGRATFEPGWKWSESVKPIVHTDLCQAPHLQYHMSGVMIVEQDGIRHVVKAGDVSMLPPGHDAWIEGDEPVHLVDFQGMLDYANSAEQQVQRITEELRSTETRHRLILGSVSDGIIGINANGEITFNNPAAASLLGYVESEMLGRKMHHLVHHSYPDGTPFPESECSSYQTFQDGRPRTVDSEVFWRKDGSSIPVEYSTTPLKQGFAMVGAIVVFRDITERKATLDAILSAKKAAEAANLAKSIFLANMSHELRTPLNAILGFSDLVRRSPGLSETQQTNLAIIQKSGDHLLGLINDVLDLAKIEAGRTQVDRAPFDLADMVVGIADMMRVRAIEKGLQLQVEQAADFPRFILDDQIKIRQILINLLSNAVKATEHGVITLRLKVDDDAGEHLVMEVEDTGIGIVPEDRERIFEAFMQSSSPGNWQGSGLGLSITRQFVALMGGRLNLASEVGKGSTFRVELPLQRARPDLLPEAAPEKGKVIGLAVGQPDYRVLVVDDNLENRLLLKQLLEQVGYRVMEAENGVEAVARFQDWKPHFIWMDRRMPVLDGLEATRQIRALPGGEAVKVAAVTASSFKQDDALLLESGFEAIVHKPFRSEEIHECMENLLGVKLVRAPLAPAAGQSGDRGLQSLGTLSEPLRQALGDAVVHLDEKRIQEVLADIGKAHPDLSAALGRLVDNYDYQTILDLLEYAPEAIP